MKSFTRRDLLKFVGAGALAASLPSSLAAQSAGSAAAKPGVNSALYRFTVGNWEAVSIAAGLFNAPKPHGVFAPQATPEQFAEALAAEFLPSDVLTLHLNVLLLRRGKENILIDAGLPGRQEAPFDLLNNLAELGLQATDITAVFLTHAHFDHMGGLLDESGKPVFSRAQHFVLEAEHDFWTSSKPDFSTSRSDAKGIEGGIAAARRVFDAISFTKLKDGAEPIAGITVVHAPGHTPGHMNLRIHSEGQELYHFADLAHHYAIMFPHPDWTVMYDVNEKLAEATRRKVFATLASSGSLVFGYHMPCPALGRIKPQASGYRWLPAPWATGKKN